ncbi:MAG: hypothetical protein HS128_01405 [Ideonella sp.]|nr:hypothetical protein [Ideonella sp.]
MHKGFHPIRWMRRLFTKPMKIRRKGLDLLLEFEPTRMAAPNCANLSRGEALRLAHQALQTLLAQHPDARHVVPHLSALEHSLARHGSRALLSLQPRVLERAMAQLDAIEGDTRSEILVALRLRVEDVIRRRRAAASAKDDVSNIEVRDASHSQFDSAASEWTGRVPLDEAPSPEEPVATVVMAR